LNVVVLAVEPSLMCYVVGWTNGAPSMTALEAAFVVWSPVNGHLKGGSCIAISTIDYDNVILRKSLV